MLAWRHLSASHRAPTTQALLTELHPAVLEIWAQLPLTRGLCPYETLLPGQKCPMGVQGSYHDCPYSSRSVDYYRVDGAGELDEADYYRVDSAHPHRTFATVTRMRSGLPPPRPGNYGRTPSERWATLQRLSAARND